jgi:hypothetical protein
MAMNYELPVPLPSARNRINPPAAAHQTFLSAYCYRAENTKSSHDAAIRQDHCLPALVRWRGLRNLSDCMFILASLITANLRTP